MTALNKQALRSREEFEEYYNETHAVKVTSQFKRFGYYVSPTMQKAWELWQKAQSSMLNELKSAENNLIDSECHVAELEESLRDKQELLEAAEKRISDLETKKADLMAHVLNGYEATTLTMTLRKMDVYLPDYLRFCSIYGVDHDAIMDKLDYQSFVLARVNNDDLRQDIEASHD